MPLFQTIVPGKPVAQPRARAVSTPIGARMYGASRDHPIHGYREQLLYVCNYEWNRPPCTEPLLMGLTFVFPRPKQMMWKTRPMYREWKDSKPDLDNLVKAVKDALSGTVYVDDRQIVGYLGISKVIASDREHPHTRIVLELAGECPRDDTQETDRCGR